MPTFKVKALLSSEFVFPQVVAVNSEHAELLVKKMVWDKYFKSAWTQFQVEEAIQGEE